MTETPWYDDQSYDQWNYEQQSWSDWNPEPTTTPVQPHSQTSTPVVQHPPQTVQSAKVLALMTTPDSINTPHSVLRSYSPARDLLAMIKPSIVTDMIASIEGRPDDLHFIIDSGASINVCHPIFAQDYPMYRSNDVNLVSASGFNASV